MISRGNYLSHYAKGQVVNGSKYSRRYMKNGEWVYVYDNNQNEDSNATTSINRNRQDYTKPTVNNSNRSTNRNERNARLARILNGVANRTPSEKSKPISDLATLTQLRINQKAREYKENKSLSDYQKKTAVEAKAAQKRNDMVNDFKANHTYNSSTNKSKVPIKKEIASAKLAGSAYKAKSNIKNTKQQLDSANYQKYRNAAKAKAEIYKKNSTNTAIYKTAVKNLASDTINKGKSIYKKLFG